MDPAMLTDEEKWDEIVVPNLPAAWRAANETVGQEFSLADYSAMRKKFLRGAREHGGDIWTMSIEQIDAEIISEVYDLTIYLAIRAWRIEQAELDS